jgi:UDP-2,3-diacylglucosamine hydrolase
MLEAVFISDLHLHPEKAAITQKFMEFMDWVSTRSRALYILGDFFHAWPGDDALDSWSLEIIASLKNVSEKGLSVYFMHGNRDFLVGESLAKKAGMQIIKDPSLINLAGEKILLSHGDRYCTEDKNHQYFRKITRNSIFSWFFMKFPFSFRNKLVMRVRDFSEGNKNKPALIMDIVPAILLKDMKKREVQTIIHGHTHKPGLVEHQDNSTIYKQYVLSDWDDKPIMLCYDFSKGLFFDLLDFVLPKSGRT